MENDILRAQALLDRKLRQQVTPQDTKFYESVGFSLEQVKQATRKKPMFFRVIDYIKNSRFIPKIKSV